MKISVIIVNYNVKNFLEQCLVSVIKASEEIESEIFVVDNHSVDGSQAMIHEKFPQIKLIENEQNFGFSKANNQALIHATGEFALVLNPDTLLEEETLKKCVAFMDAHPEAGALGVKMINGKGRYLPESKRALPTPAVAFFRIFGLSKLFPNSKKFGKYHLSYLDPNKIHAVEILSGAFMFIRKKALDKAGLFDEQFFMYGEDIDLSYRIIKEGYTNYYLPETTIIHYKGESTKKSSLNYVLTFYHAMLIFAVKHFSKKQTSILFIAIKLAVWFRAGLSALKRSFKKIFIPFTDFLFMFVGMYSLTWFWEQVKFGENYSYPSVLFSFIIPSYILVWMGSLVYSGAYKKKVRFKIVVQGIILGTIVILIVYSLLPETLRFSRILIIAGTAVSLLAAVLSRWLASFMKISDFAILSKPVNRIAIAASSKECVRIKSLLNSLNTPYQYIGRISQEKEMQDAEILGTIEHIEEITDINKIDEIIFSSRDIASRQIILNILKLSGKNISFRIASAVSESILEPHSADAEIFHVSLNPVNTLLNRFKKRIFDIALSVILILIFPLLLPVIKKPSRFLTKLFKVLSGKITWVGHNMLSEGEQKNSLILKTGVFSPSIISGNRELNKEEDMTVTDYARNYQIKNDIKIIYSGIKSRRYY